MSIESVLNLARTEIRALQSYDNLRGQTSADAVIMDSNENIASPIERFTQEKRYRYPEIRPKAVIERLAAIYKVEPQQIMLGRGSDDVIDSLIRVFCEAGRDSIFTSVTVFFNVWSLCTNTRSFCSQSSARKKQ